MKAWWFIYLDVDVWPVLGMIGREELEIPVVEVDELDDDLDEGLIGWEDELDTSVECWPVLEEFIKSQLI